MYFAKVRSRTRRRKDSKSDPKFESLLKRRLFQTLVFPVNLGDGNARYGVERVFGRAKALRDDIVGKVIESLIESLGAVKTVWQPGAVVFNIN